MARILLIDDDSGGRQMAAYNLSSAGHHVDEAENGRVGLESFDPALHELVITDVRMPGISGIELTSEISGRAPDTPVLVITAFGTVDVAVEAMQAGAEDFVLKPFSRDQLLVRVNKALERRRLSQENAELRRRLRGIERPIVYQSAAMERVVALTDKVAGSAAAVLICGESGTGKELIARRIHGRSSRAAGPFIEVNCAAIPETLIEAELFGHAKGAFTGADKARQGRFRQADGGTLFLDEIAELPPPAQSKMLRVLQEGVIDILGSDQAVRVDVRIIAATNRDLREEIEAGSFREDLYFRLNVIELELPPLRTRPEDIPALVHHFIDELAPGGEMVVEEQLLEQLQGRRWPGNVRELRNACERMVVLSSGDSLSAAVLTDERQSTSAAAKELDAWLSLPEEGFSLLDLEKRVIERVLVLKGGNMSETARYLRIPRHVLVYRIEKYGIERPAKP